jgi:hypothetical protein
MNIHFALPAALALVTGALSGCADAAASPAPPAANEATAAATADALDTPSAKAFDAKANAGCRWVEAVARPIGVSHFQDPKLQQTAGQLFARFSSRDEVEAGTILATVLGPDAGGTLRGNHHLLFRDGVLRTKNDPITVTPSADACKLDVRSELMVVDGTGALKGLTGTLTAQGTLDVCGAPGRIRIAGKLCAAK